MASKESLFSLEVVVEKLSLLDVTCRFPTIAFRLLDFPTLMINHVGVEQSMIIKQKLGLELGSNLPRQFKELQDKNGCFTIKRGKSCLLKISIEILQRYLTASPLYILLTDSFPDIPKLVGSCFVSLENIIDQIVYDVQKNGLTIPTTHGEKGTHQLYNLMGIEIGNLTIAYRLLSLGEGLIQHIPESEIFTVGENAAQFQDTKVQYIKKISENVSKNNEQLSSKNPAPDKIADSILSDVRKSFEKETKTVSKKLIDQSLQTIEIEVDQPSVKKVISTQTDSEPSTRKVSFETPTKVKGESDVDDDFYIVNTYTPPSLFFHNSCEKQSPNKYQIFKYVNIEEKEQTDDKESVRSDDKIFDILEVGLDHSLIKHEEPSFFHQLKQNDSLKSQIIPEPIIDSHKRNENAAQMLSQHGFDDKNFPFLRALISELNFLQSPQHLKQVQNVNGPNQQNKREQTKPRTIIAWNNDAKENRSEFLTRLSDPKQKSKPRRKFTHECENPVDTSMPKERGWIRKEPLYGKRKSKLVYGMTHTQKLRCAMHGQGSYAKEIEEARRSQQKPSVRKLSVSDQQKQVSQPASKSNLSATKVIQKPSGTPPKKQETVKSRKAPVPTPRRTPTPSFDDQSSQPSPEVPERSRRLSPVPYISPEEDTEDSEQVTNSNSTPRSIEIHMPKQMHELPDDFGVTRNIDELYSNVQNVGGVNISMPAPDGDASNLFDDSQQWQSVDEPELRALKDSDEEPESGHQSSPSIESPVNVRSSLVKPIVNPKSSDRSPQTVQVRRSTNLAKSIDADSSADSKLHVKPKQSVSFEGSLNSDSDHKMPPIKKPNTVSSQESLDEVKELQKLPRIRRSTSVESDGKGKRKMMSPTRNFSERPKLQSIHTDSVSSYFPSDADNQGISFDNSTDTYTEDFEGSDMDFPHYIPSTKLGYTIS